MPSPRGRPEAIVAPAAADAVLDVERISPSDELAEYVDYHWLVRWRDVERHLQQVVPQPRIHIAAENGRLEVHGICRESFTRTMVGTGHVLGTAFHAGGFRPLLQRSVASISNTVQPALDLFAIDDRPIARRILDHGDQVAMVAALEDFLLRTNPIPDPRASEVTALVAEAERRTDITQADQLARHAGISVRSLQRLFAEYIGVGPKWVLQRLRILQAAGAAHASRPADWSMLSIELGFSDQSHLTRAFTSVVGTPPRTYERCVRTSQT